MSVGYQAIHWNRHKRIYDATIVSSIVLYLALFIGVGAVVNPNATLETLIIRGLGTCALLLLHIILCIGPLSRLTPRFLPLLYNRRHLGVATFLLGLAHGVFALIQFHALGNVHPLVSLFASNARYDSLANFPFQPLGFFALLILFLMAATSHDFWLTNLTAPVWKRLHMLVYLSYGLLLAHVALGVLQAETNGLLATLLGVGMVIVLGLHWCAAQKEKAVDATDISSTNEEFVLVCKVEDISENRARIVSLAGERIAIFKYGNNVSALSNVCQHQNGPLGEGKIMDGCVTCPWHGFQYLPASGASPAPFTEKVPTFIVKIVGSEIFVHPHPLPPGTHVAPAQIHEGK